MSRTESLNAVVLAAGLGSRLGEMTQTRPKPLTPVAGIPILHRCLAQLQRVGVHRVTIVVGHLHGVVIESVSSAFPNMAIDFVVSSDFATTGSAYSLWLARKVLAEGDTLVLEGDVVFDPVVIDRVVEGTGDIAAVDEFAAGMSGSAAVVDDGWQVNEILLNQTGQGEDGRPLYKTINIYALTRECSRQVLIPALEAAIVVSPKAYVERVLSEAIADGRLRLSAAVCRGLRWMEIDTPDDLNAAEQMFAAG